MAAAQIRLGRENIRAGRACGGLGKRRNDPIHLFERVRRSPVSVRLTDAHQYFNLNSRLDGGGMGGSFLQFKLLRANLNLFEV